MANIKKQPLGVSENRVKSKWETLCLFIVTRINETTGRWLWLPRITEVQMAWPGRLRFARLMGYLTDHWLYSIHWRLHLSSQSLLFRLLVMLVPMVVVTLQVINVKCCIRLPSRRISESKSGVQIYKLTAIRIVWLFIEHVLAAWLYFNCGDLSH